MSKMAEVDTMDEKLEEQTQSRWPGICPSAELGCVGTRDPNRFKTFCENIQMHPICTYHSKPIYKQNKNTENANVIS